VGRHPVRVEEGDGGAARRLKGDGLGAVACMAETLRHRVGGHRASLGEGDGARRKEQLREWQSGEGGYGSFIPIKSGRYLPRHTELAYGAQDEVTGGSPQRTFTLRRRFARISMGGTDRDT
jgi:hypothetical protein